MREWPLLKDDRGHVLPEIAVAGRSNVGKSSLMNHLFRAKKLARVSSTPGKTQLLNFFVMNKLISIVDLPGYGFADVPLKVRKQWGPMMQEYLSKRDELKLLLFLFDIRRLPNDDDLQFMQWIAYAKKTVILVLTKVDKVSRNELIQQTQKIISAFEIPNLPHIHYSVPKNVGREGLIRMIKEGI
jgi:GTP-binding protein